MIDWRTQPVRPCVADRHQISPAVSSVLLSCVAAGRGYYFLHSTFPTHKHHPAMQASLRSTLLLLLAGLCSLALFGQAFLLPAAAPSCPRALVQGSKAAAAGAVAAPLRPSSVSPVLRAAADGGVGAEVGAVESCRRKIQEALTPVELVVRLSSPCCCACVCTPAGPINQLILSVDDPQTRPLIHTRCR